MKGLITKKDRKYVALLVGLFTLFIVAEYNAPKPIDWKHSYSRTDKIPFGNYLLYELLPNLFESPTKLNYQTFFEAFQTEEEDNKKRVIMIICENFSPDSIDTNVLYEQASDGNHIFVATTGISGKLADTLKLNMSRNFQFYDADMESNPHQIDSLGIQFANPTLADTAAYYFKWGITPFYFNKIDTVNAKIIGTNTNGLTNYIKVPVGEGAFWLHANPLVFTNYNVLQEKPRRYIETALSYLPQYPVLWDEYYKTGRLGARTPLRFILSNEPLRWAYYTLIITLLLFVFFQAKRRQRIIPIVEPPKNTSLEFVETIGQLYFQQKNHTDLARKKTGFFKEHLRNTFFIASQPWEKEAIRKVALKSNVAQEEVENLFNSLKEIEKKGVVTEMELNHISKQIERFKSRSLV